MLKERTSTLASIDLGLSESNFSSPRRMLDFEEAPWLKIPSHWGDDVLKAPLNLSQIASTYDIGYPDMDHPFEIGRYPKYDGDM